MTDWINEWINELINDEAVNRTAPATPGLLITNYLQPWEQFEASSTSVLIEEIEPEDEMYPSITLCKGFKWVDSMHHVPSCLFFYDCKKYTKCWQCMPFLSIINRPHVAKAVLQTHL